MHNARHMSEVAATASGSMGLARRHREAQKWRWRIDLDFEGKLQSSNIESADTFTP